jgi:LacI family transcriptional regulator
MDLRELATQLGLSMTTVSRALNGYPEVSAKTRARVVAAATEAGYHANPTARRLATGRSDTIGLLMTLPADRQVPAAVLTLIPALAEGVRTAGLDLLVIAAPQPDLEAAAARLLKGRRVDLIVTLAVGADEGPLVQRSGHVTGSDQDGPFASRLVETILTRLQQGLAGDAPIHVQVSGGQTLKI